MAKEKKVPKGEGEERQTRVLLEQIRSDVRIVAEQQGGIVKRLDNIEGDVTVLKEDVSIIKVAVKEHTKQLQEHKSILQEHTKQLQELREGQTGLKEGQAEIKEGQVRIEKKFDSIVVDHEERLKKLEMV